MKLIFSIFLMLLSFNSFAKKNTLLDVSDEEIKSVFASQSAKKCLFYSTRTDQGKKLCKQYSKSSKYSFSELTSKKTTLKFGNVVTKINCLERLNDKNRFVAKGVYHDPICVPFLPKK